jgi:hypothetical protein
MLTLCAGSAGERREWILFIKSRMRLPAAAGYREHTARLYNQTPSGGVPATPVASAPVSNSSLGGGGGLRWLLSRPANRAAAGSDADGDSLVWSMPASVAGSAPLSRAASTVFDGGAGVGGGVGLPDGTVAMSLPPLPAPLLRRASSVGQLGAAGSEASAASGAAPGSARGGDSDEALAAAAYAAYYAYMAVPVDPLAQWRAALHRHMVDYTAARARPGGGSAGAAAVGSSGGRRGRAAPGSAPAGRRATAAPAAAAGASDARVRSDSGGVRTASRIGQLFRRRAGSDEGGRGSGSGGGTGATGGNRE